MADIFVSYKREEKHLAQKLHQALEGKGYQVWWDVDLLPGDNFIDSIERIIDDSKLVITLWSKLSVKSRYVRSESRRALNQEKHISALVDVDVSNLPMPFDEYQAVNIEATGSNPNSLDRLLNVIEKKLPLPKTLKNIKSSAEKKYTQQPKGYDWKSQWKIAIGFDDISEYRRFLEYCSAEADIEVVEAAKRRIQVLKKMSSTKLVRWLLPVGLSVVIAGAAVLNLYFSNLDKKTPSSSSAGIVQEGASETEKEDISAKMNLNEASGDIDSADSLKENVKAKTDLEDKAEKRESIKEVQRLLQSKKYSDGEYYYNGAIDGLAGKETHYALQKFLWVSGEKLENPIDWAYWANFLRDSEHDAFIKDIQSDLHRTGFLKKEEITGLKTNAYSSALKLFLSKLPSISWSQVDQLTPELKNEKLSKEFNTVGIIQQYQNKKAYFNLFNFDYPMKDGRSPVDNFIKFDVLIRNGYGAFLDTKAEPILIEKRAFYEQFFDISEKSATDLYLRMKPFQNGAGQELLSIQEEYGSRATASSFQALGKYEEGVPRASKYITPTAVFELASNRYIIANEFVDGVQKAIILPDFSSGSFQEDCASIGGISVYKTRCGVFEVRDIASYENKCQLLFDSWEFSSVITTALKLNLIGQAWVSNPPSTETKRATYCSFSINLSDYELLKSLN